MPLWIGSGRPGRSRDWTESTRHEMLPSGCRERARTEMSCRLASRLLLGYSSLRGHRPYDGGRRAFGSESTTPAVKSRSRSERGHDASYSPARIKGATREVIKATRSLLSHDVSERANCHACWECAVHAVDERDFAEGRNLQHAVASTSALQLLPLHLSMNSGLQRWPQE